MIERDVAAIRARRAERERLLATPDVEASKIKNQNLSPNINATLGSALAGTTTTTVTAEREDTVMSDEPSGTKPASPMKAMPVAPIQNIQSRDDTMIELDHPTTADVPDVATHSRSDIEPVGNTVPMTAADNVSTSGITVTPYDESRTVPVVAEIEDSNFESMFTDDGTNAEVAIDLAEFDFSDTTDINPTFGESNTFELLNGPPALTNSKDISSEDINSLLPGLDKYVHDDLSMMDFAPTTSVSDIPSLYTQSTNAAPIITAPQPAGPAPYDTSFDDIFGSGGFSTGASGDAEMANYGNMGDIGDFDDDAWLNM